MCTLMQSRSHLAAILLAVAFAPLALPAELTPVEVVCVDEQAAGYATFQSHNQKVLSNRHGIFMTYIRSRNEDYTAQQWRLLHSVDGGRKWSIVYEATNATNPPVIETDEDGNLYLVRPDFVDRNAYLYRFLAKEGFAKPLISTIPKGAAGKFCMTYDAGRRQLYYFAHNNTFHVVGLDGKVRSSQVLLQRGKNALLQYPLLSLAADGSLYAAWTTQKHGVYLYWDIHHMRSADGGKTWTTLEGKPITLPAVADDGGPAQRVSLDDEFEVHTWLSNMIVAGGKLHFLYLAQTDPAREHYVRYDVGTGREDWRISPTFSGKEVSLAGLSGFFASGGPGQDVPLYCVSAFGGRIACLVSRDKGQTWQDHAASEKTFAPYSIGGCRELTSDGYVIGSFTQHAASPADSSGKCPVYFFRIATGQGSR